jgi:hypothetical protein
VTSAAENTTDIPWVQALQIWWGVTWRQVVITFVVSFATCVGTVPLVGNDPELLEEVLESPLSDWIGAVGAALIHMIAIRQALLANYTTFSLTLLERGSDEPGRIHKALGAGRMLRIWWAAIWPLYLVIYGALLAAARLGVVLPGFLPDELGLEPTVAATLGTVLALSLAWVGLSIGFLWRALRKQYSQFRLVSLRPWSEQVRD